MTDIPIGSIVRLHTELGDDGLVCVVIGVTDGGVAPLYRIGEVRRRRLLGGARIAPLRDRLVGPRALEVLHTPRQP